MMCEKAKYKVTSEGLKKLEVELLICKTDKREVIAKKIKESLGFGDLSENAKYVEAKNEQALLEGRIAQLEHMLKNIIVVDVE